MPVHCRIRIRALSVKEFKAIDYRLMSHAFASQNELGRLCDESVYQTDLAARMAADGYEIHTRVPVTVTHQDFEKAYYLDLVASDALYELKAAMALVDEHTAQILNYMLLLGLRCGKLLSFRSTSVQGHLVVTPLNDLLRRRITVDATRWRELSSRCRLLRNTMTNLLEDSGAFP